MDATHRYTAPDAVARYRGRALLAGADFLVAGVVLAYTLGSYAGYGGFVQVFRSYLVGFFFCTGIAVGSLAWLALGHMTGGAWALTSRRLFEAATRTIPLCAVFFIPIIISLFVHERGAAGQPVSLYEWSDPSVVAGDPALQHKGAYLNIPFFVIRAAVYFGIWFFFASRLNR